MAYSPLVLPLLAGDQALRPHPARPAERQTGWPAHSCPGVSTLNISRNIDKNRRDIDKYQSKWTASKMETPGARRALSGGHINRAAMDKDQDHILLHGANGSEQLLLGAHQPQADTVEIFSFRSPADACIRTRTYITFI
eukprot:COSAG01_NODE_269_length_19814_cov_109.983720_11_plen_139_part_00